MKKHIWKEENLNNEHLSWYILSKKYVEYLQRFDSLVQNIDYGCNEIKPYIGIVLQINNFDYYVPISSTKEKHYKMKEGKDFVIIKEHSKILGVINLNNMIPVLPSEVNVLKYNSISNYRNFRNNSEKYKYISLLDKELDLINARKEEICIKARKLYDEKFNNPNSRLSKRCCNFKLLEEKSIEYSTAKELDNEETQ